MNFEVEKKRYMDNLYKPDKSRKGNVDKEISYLVDHINELEDYYTTSSCAGRIVLIDYPKDWKKQDVKWIFTSHALVDKIELDKLEVREYPIWFKQESFILHVCAKTFEGANDMLMKARQVGFKRAGIIATTKRFIVEIMSTENISTPIHDGEKFLIDQNYMDVLVEEANNKMQTSRDRVKKFFELL